MKTAELNSYVTAFIVTVVASSVQAQDHRLADQALQCSAVLEMLAQPQDQTSESAQRLLSAVETFTEIHRRALGAKASVSVAQIQQQRQQLQAQMRASRNERAAYFREDAVVCGAWAEGYLAQGKQYQYMVVYPKVIAPHVRTLYQGLADQVLAIPLPQ